MEAFRGFAESKVLEICECEGIAAEGGIADD